MIFASVTDNYVGLGIALAMIGYLIFVLVFPERF